MNWYKVTFDAQNIYRDVTPPGRKTWRDSLAWANISRICFETADMFGMDTIYIFVKGREASYEIPLLAEGASALWGEIVARKLFDAELAIKVALEQGVHCWPAD